MADDKPSLHIDTDWKKQAQEEKKRLVEQEAKRAQEKEQRPPTPAAPPIPGLPPEAAPSPRGAKSRTSPEASFASHIQSVMTQVLYYLGDLAPRGSEPQLNLDLAKHHIDTLGMLEEKTKSNLSPDEQRTLDGALYETRMRFVSVASQLMGP